MADTKSNAKRLAKRLAKRDMQRAMGIKKTPKPLPPAPIITFYLAVDIVNIEDREPGGAVGIRSKHVHHIGHGWKRREVVEYGKWRVFKGATLAIDRRKPPFVEYVGVTAPITSWQQAGLLEQLVDRDLPRQRPKRTRKQKKVDLATFKQALKEAA